MNTMVNLGRSPLLPLAALCGYLGLTITTLHLEIPLLLSLHVELLFFVAVLGATFIYSVFIEKTELSYSHPLFMPLLLVSGYALAPILASLATENYLAILGDGEYKSLLKILFFAPCFFYFLSKRKFQAFLLKCVLFFYFILGVYFLYRYLILNEVRAFDLRPTLQIRHGDPNFLCTFFAMNVPVALLQSWRSLKDGKKLQAMLYSLGAVFFSVCAMVTESRMGILALLLGLTYLATREFPGFRQTRQLRIGFLALVVLIAGTVAVQGSIAKRFSEINDKSSIDRLLTYENGLKVFLDNPVFGAGMHQARETFYENSQYPSFQSESKRLEVHNTYLNILAELGVFGLVAFAGLLCWAFSRISKAMKPEQYFLMASLGILLLAGMTVGVSYKDLVILQIFTLAGLGQVHNKEASC